MLPHDDTKDIEDACFRLARTTKWTRTPIDADEITAQAAPFTKVALERIYDPLDRSAAVVARAVNYIAQAHGMPMGEDTSWFEHMLDALLEVARPNTGLDPEGKAFLADMVRGIAIARQG